MAQNRMKRVHRFLTALLVLAVFYAAFGFFKVRQDLFAVYDVPDRYAYNTEGADLVVVDFNKYGCDHCRALHPILMEAVRRDGKVRYIPRTITYGAAWEKVLVSSVYAAAEQGKFIEMHDMIYQTWPIADRSALFAHARTLGLDIEKLRRDMAQKETLALVEKNQVFFDAWKLTRTPSLLLGEKIIYTPGSETPSVEDMLEEFENARS